MIQARLAAEAQWLAYRVTGMLACEVFSPSHAIALFSLTRGCAVVTIDGLEARREHHLTEVAGRAAYALVQKAERQTARGEGV